MIINQLGYSNFLFKRITFHIYETYAYIYYTKLITMIQFKNLLHRLSPTSKLDFNLVVNVRRMKMEQEGYNTDYINWEHYAKVLEAKHSMLSAT